MDATIVVSPIETLRLGDFDPTSPSSAPLIFTVTIRADDVERNLRAVVRVAGERVGLLGSATANLGRVPARTTVVLTNREFSSYDLADAANDLVDFASERGVLPADNYSFSLTVHDSIDDVVGEDEDVATTSDGAAEVFALAPGVPVGDTPEFVETPQPIFLWQSDAGRFNFSLYEVRDPSASPDDIAASRPVFVQDGIELTTFAYPAYAEALKPGSTYAWLVESVLQTAAGAEGVPAEMLWFTMRGGASDKLEAAPGLTSISVAPQEQEIPPAGVVQLTAEGFDANATPLGAIDVGWQVVPASGGEVTSEGLFTASDRPGVVAVVAERGDLSDFATITISNGARTPRGRDSVYVAMLSPSEGIVLMEPSPTFSWQIFGADSSAARVFRLSLAEVDEDAGTSVPLWARDVRNGLLLRYPSDEGPLESGRRYIARVALLDSSGAIAMASDPVEFALNRDPKISWELYNAWDEAQRNATDSVHVTMLTLIAGNQLTTSLRDRIVQAGATIEVAEGPWLQLRVPFASLPELAAIDLVRMMTLPSPHVLFHRRTALGDRSSAHVTPLLESSAPERFAPIDVAIFEFGFDRAAVEELVDPSRVRYHTFRQDNRIEGTGGADALHGVATLKAMVEYLPENATIHLVNFNTEPEFQQALRFAVDELNARVLTCSVSWANAYDDYDGTSFFSQNIEETLGEKAALVVAAGNFAESHWESTFNDANGDGAHDFSQQDSYLELELSSSRRYNLLLSWDEWTAPNRDLDIEILDARGEPLFDRYGRPYASRNLQADGQFAEPLERIRGFRPPFAGTQKYRLRVLSATPERTRPSPPAFELYIYPPPVSAAPAAQPASSLASGIATTRSQHVIPVGASGFKHSSRGPTNDGRVRPDFSTRGALEYSSRRFEGTSFATPRVAAALGSVLARHPEWTLEQAVTYLRQFVTPADPGNKDNVIGWGTLDLETLVSSL